MLRSVLIITGVVSLFLNIYWLILYYYHKKFLSDEVLSSRERFVSIIVPAFNEEDNIENCLESLVSLDYSRKKLEIIVVDDASTDNTFRMASGFAAKHSFVKVFRNKNSSGKKSRALNYGVKKISSDSEVVVVLDADSSVHPDTLRRVMWFFDQDYDAVSMRYMPSNRNSFLAKLQVFEYMYSILWRKILSVLDSMYVTPGVFSAYSLKALKKVGFFNDNCYSEDMELALRLQKKGFRIGYSFFTTAFTKVPTTLKHYFRQRVRWYRGYFDSLRIHRDVLFNRGLGNFGLVMMPLNFLSSVFVVFVSLIFLTTLLDWLINFFDWVYKLYLINFDLPNYLSRLFDFSGTSITMVVNKAFLSLDLLSFIFLFSFILAIVMLVLIKKRTQEVSARDLLYFPFFLFFYLPLNSVLWLYSLCLEFFRTEKKW